MVPDAVFPDRPQVLQTPPLPADFRSIETEIRLFAMEPGSTFRKNSCDAQRSRAALKKRERDTKRATESESGRRRVILSSACHPSSLDRKSRTSLGASKW